MPSTYFELMLREFGGCSENLRTELLAGTGVDRVAPGGEITLGQHLRLVRNLHAQQEPGWALRMGRRLVPSTHGPLSFAAVGAPTLAQGMAALERFAHVRAPCFRLHSRKNGDRFLLRVEEHAALTDEERIPLLEMLLSGVQGLVEVVLGRAMHEATLWFSHAPPAYAAKYADYFHGRIRFGAAETALEIPSRWLAHNCPTADPMMFESSLRQLETLARRLESGDHIAARVEQLLATSGKAVPSLAEAATRLHVSQRTLIRRLAREGTSYRGLVDAHRREHARSLLLDPHLDVAEVCYQLGYGDLANFGRACRRWFGMPPRSYRRLLQEGRPVPTDNSAERVG